MSITSQYGEFDIAELESWVNDLDKDLAESLRLVDEELELFVGGLNEGEEEDETNNDEIDFIENNEGESGFKIEQK